VTSYSIPYPYRSRIAGLNRRFRTESTLAQAAQQRLNIEMGMGHGVQAVIAENELFKHAKAAERLNGEIRVLVKDILDEFGMYDFEHWNLDVMGMKIDKVEVPKTVHCPQCLAEIEIHNGGG